MNPIGMRVREARLARRPKWTQRELADYVKQRWPDVPISQQSLGEFETTEGATTVALPWIAMALNVSLPWLLTGAGPMRPAELTGNTIGLHLTERDPPRYSFEGEVGKPGGHLADVTSDGASFHIVPLLTWAQAGDPSMQSDRLAIPEQRYRCPVPCSPSAFALRIESDFGAGFTRGSVIFVDPTVAPLNDMFVIVATPEHPEPVLRQVVTDGGRHYVRPVGDHKLDHARELGVEARLLGVILCRTDVLVPSY